jgi:MFS transporter, DHA2 family, multidrug resistance protein
MMPDMATSRLRGWHFLLFNLVLGLAHMAVLFNAASYIAFLPHVAGDLGGVLPSFGTWAQTDFMIALALAFPIARWLSDRFGESRVFIGACLASPPPGVTPRRLGIGEGPAGKWLGRRP